MRTPVWIRRLLAGKSWRVYDPSDPEATSAAIAADVASGALRCEKAWGLASIYNWTEWRCANADVYLRVEYPDVMGGSFTYVWVSGVEVSDLRDFDMRRVRSAMRHGVDPGPTSREERADLWSL